MYSSLTLVKLPTDTFLNGITIVAQEKKYYFWNCYGNIKKDTDFQEVVDLKFRMNQWMAVNFFIKLYPFLLLFRRKGISTFLRYGYVHFLMFYSTNIGCDPQVLCRLLEIQWWNSYVHWSWGLRLEVEGEVSKTVFLWLCVWRYSLREVQKMSTV